MDKAQKKLNSEVKSFLVIWAVEIVLCFVFIFWGHWFLTVLGAFGLFLVGFGFGRKSVDLNHKVKEAYPDIH